MGGTWVTHHMGYLFREMVRYGMDRDLITTGSPDMHKGYYTMDVPGMDNRSTVFHRRDDTKHNYFRRCKASKVEPRRSWRYASQGLGYIC